MSAAELIKQVAALPPQERTLFEELLHAMENGDRARTLAGPPAATPDFLARARAIWGETPPGKSLSAVVSEARADES